MRADNVEHKFAAMDGSGNKPARRSSNLQHLTINTNLGNISSQGRGNGDD